MAASPLWARDISMQTRLTIGCREIPLEKPVLKESR
jgi:hypothetical protein